MTHEKKYGIQDFISARLIDLPPHSPPPICIMLDVKIFVVTSYQVSVLAKLAAVVLRGAGGSEKPRNSADARSFVDNLSTDRSLKRQ